MELFGVGPLELMLILVIALVIVGPEKLPEMARNAGRTINGIRSQMAELSKVVSLDSLDPQPKSSTAHIPGIHASDLPDERITAMERYHIVPAHEPQITYEDKTATAVEDEIEETRVA